ncbi:MAG: hypothetical protein H0X30_21975 [Anaerolineae bacterium]|nr:hypothetical protein [Anaerolineae bacterium]
MPKNKKTSNQNDEPDSSQVDTFNHHSDDQSELGSLGVSDYDSEFRSGQGSFYDRDSQLPTQKTSKNRSSSETSQASTDKKESTSPSGKTKRDVSQQ